MTVGLSPTAPSGRPLQRRAARTRQKILDATIDTLTDRGYAACSMPEMCKRAGVSRGAQLHHFPTKAELLAAACEELMTRRHLDLRDALRETPPAERANQLVDKLWPIYSGPTFYAWLELTVAARTDHKLREHMTAVTERFYEQAYETLAQFFELKPNARSLLPVLTRIVTCFMDGVAANHIVDGDPELTRATLSMFAHALTSLSDEFVVISEEAR